MLYQLPSSGLLHLTMWAHLLPPKPAIQSDFVVGSACCNLDTDVLVGDHNCDQVNIQPLYHCDYFRWPPLPLDKGR